MRFESLIVHGEEGQGLHAFTKQRTPMLVPNGITRPGHPNDRRKASSAIKAQDFHDRQVGWNFRPPSTPRSSLDSVKEYLK